MAAEVVTGETREAFMAKRMGMSAPMVEDAKVISETLAPEVKEPEATEIEAIEDEHKEPEQPKRKPKLEERFSELTAQRKAAEARAAEAERKLAEAEAKANPKPVEKIDGDIGPKPKPADYTDAFEYAEDLSKWSIDKALKDRDQAEVVKAQKAEQEKVVKGWQKRIVEIKTELPDYDDVISSADNLAVSDDVRDAIIESEVGPKILYHLAQNPELVDSINGMTVRGALRAMGKLEAQFEKAPEKQQEKPATKVAAIRPPDPITPIRATGSVDNKVDAKGEFQGTYAQFKALRAAGKV